MVALALKTTKNSIFAIIGAVKGGVLTALDEHMRGVRMGLKCHWNCGVLLDQLVLWLQRCKQCIAASLRHCLALAGSKCLISLTF